MRSRQVERAEPIGPAPLSAAILTAFLTAMLATAVAYAGLVPYSRKVALSGFMASVAPEAAEAELFAAEDLARCLAPGQAVALRSAATPNHAVAAGTIRSVVAAVPAYRVRVSLEAAPFAPGAPLSAIVTVDTRSLLAWLMAWPQRGRARMSCTS